VAVVLLVSMFRLVSAERTDRLRLVQPDSALPSDPLFRVTRMTSEILDAVEILSPLDTEKSPVGKFTQLTRGPALIIVNSRGRPIMYYVEESAVSRLPTKNAGPRLVRLDLTDTSLSVIVEDVEKFEVIVPEHRRGLPARQVNLKLTHRDPTDAGAPPIVWMRSMRLMAAAPGWDGLEVLR